MFSLSFLSLNLCTLSFYIVSQPITVSFSFSSVSLSYLLYSLFLSVLSLSLPSFTLVSFSSVSYPLYSLFLYLYLSLFPFNCRSLCYKLCFSLFLLTFSLLSNTLPVFPLCHIRSNLILHYPNQLQSLILSFVWSEAFFKTLLYTRTRTCIGKYIFAIVFI